MEPTRAAINPAETPCEQSAHAHVAPSRVCCDDPWEAAYLRFETPSQEIRKFMRRLERMGARTWSRDAEVVELFCGRGNGLRALDRLGFRRTEGVDLSAKLLGLYRGPARCTVGDCRQLHFDDASKDIVVVQGGLHHLPSLPGDLDRTLAEIRRVLRDGGLVAIVEPWPTPFLSFVHAFCCNRMARRASPRIDALATMIDHERPTYEAWLSQPRIIRDLLGRYFDVAMATTSWGKLQFVGRKIPAAG